MSAIDDLQALQGQLSGRAGMLDSMFGDLSGLSGNASGVYNNFFQNQNTATGLSPEALSALRTQGTAGINDQYQSAAQAMNSQLLRRGAIGGGQLPGSGGDFSRAYQPLYGAMEAAKTKANTDTILADEAAKQKSLYQNQQLALGAANNLYGNANTLFNSGNAALLGAGTLANDAATLEGPDIWKLLGTSALTGLLNPGSGGQGGQGGGNSLLQSLIRGTGTNNSGNWGILGDILGKIPGLGGGDNLGGGPTIPPPSQQTIDKALEGIQWPGSGNTSSTGTTADAAGKVASSDNSGLWEAFNQLPQIDQQGPQNMPTDGEAGQLDPSLAETASKYGSAAIGAVKTAAMVTGHTIGEVATTIGGMAEGAAHAAIGLLTNPWTAVAGAAILGAVAWTKSQAHWEANTWTKGFQQPFDQKMQDIHTQVNQLKQSGQYTPEVAQQVQAASQDAINSYLQKLDTFYREKGTNSDQAKVASQAWQTFQKYYGPGGSLYQSYLDA